MMFNWDELDRYDRLFVAWAFVFQIALIIHFALRKPFFDTYTQNFGWIVYALCVPAVIVSMILWRGGSNWTLWLGGFLFLIYAVYGYWVDYVLQIPWRNPLQLSILFPYVFLYLATVMFYWWPLWGLSRPLWVVYIRYCAADDLIV